jgi:raffinose synthase
MKLEFVGNALQLDGATLLSVLPENTTVLGEEEGNGVFLRLATEENSARHIFSLGQIAGLQRWAVARRNEPFWMLPAVGTKTGEVPIETQFLLAQTSGDNYVLVVPLLDGVFRASLQGDAQNDNLQVVVESGDLGVVGREFTPLFLAVGDDPFALIEYSAQVVRQHLGTGRLREEKAEASFSDVFGWCTWDAFYQDVSHDKVREGLESFARGGVQPRLLILDDGWQSVRETSWGSKQLTSFAPNDKFGGDLSATVEMAKGEFGVETFMVWHAFNGYWGGVDGEALPGYGTRNTERRSSPGMLHYNPTLDAWWKPVAGVVAPEHIYRFYHDYHRSLRAQGVDGVKVDVQAAIEAVGAGLGRTRRFDARLSRGT